MKRGGGCLQPDANARRTKLLADIDVTNMRGLEIGPLDRPLIRPDEGDIRYADHAARSDLVVKYAGDQNVDVNAIPEVDYVLYGQSLTDAVCEPDFFDYVVASHVIEHIPDTVGWLKDIHRVLKPGGVLALAIPDKRFTFDHFRPLTTPGQLLEFHERGLRQPCTQQVFDHYVFHAPLSEHDIWSGQLDETRLIFAHSPAEALAHVRSARAGNYMDSHCTTWTPASFADNLRHFSLADILRFEVAHLEQTQPGRLEFVVSLRKARPEVDAEAIASTIPHIRYDTFEAEMRQLAKTAIDSAHSAQQELAATRRYVADLEQEGMKAQSAIQEMRAEITALREHNAILQKRLSLFRPLARLILAIRRLTRRLKSQS